MNSVYLIGMMGCGKTTCARLLGARLGRPVVDTDVCIAESAGMTVSEIFARYGEEHFRALETGLCRSLAEKDGLIVACGGGLPLREENRTLLRASGQVIFLNRDPGRIYDTTSMADRPLAQQGRDDFLRRFAQRKPLYRQAAHHIIGDYPTPEQTVAEILKFLEV